MAAYQYIYVMKGLGKTYPGGREVLREIWLSFFPGAKIGVLGLNGAGKSTLLRIMAGQERDFSGEAWAAEGAAVGYLPQEPALDPEKDVAGNVMEGLAATKALLDRFEEVSDVVVCVGRAVPDLATVDRTLLESRQVADALPATSPREDHPRVHRLQDVHVRGLLALLGDDERVRLFVDRELGALRAADAAGRTGDLVAALRALLSHPGSKSEAASSLHLSRAAFYDRLAKIEKVLDVDLDDPDIRLSLHLALVADELSSQTGPSVTASR